MLTLNINCEVMPDRVVTFKLPETVRPGRHELVVVLEEDKLAQVKSKRPINPSLFSVV